MRSGPARIVDAHVHFWDPANTDWYPYLSGGMKLDLGDTTGMNRKYDRATYRAESSGWNVEKVVHVAAATGMHSVEETLAVEARGEADALVGGIPPTASVADAVVLLDRQAVAPGFRGVRPMGAFDGPLPARGVLEALAERGLVFEVLARPDGLAAAATGLDGIDGLTVVVEHAGWLRTTDEAEVALWDAGLAALAGLGPHVVCKLSGFALPVGSMSPAALAPWIERVVDRFGPDRCLFASNFPVDGLHGSLDELWSAYAEVVDGLGLDADAVDQLFAGTAERIYGL